MTAELLPITKEAFQKYLDLKRDAAAYEERLTLVAREIAFAAFGQSVTRFKYTATDVYVDSPYDNPSHFKVEWLWDPEWRTRLEEYRAEERRRLDAMVERLRKESAIATQKKELEELARLKAKYPDAFKAEVKGG
jgi:hypothetical protein